MLAAALLPSAIKLGTSLYQMYQGNKLGSTARPDSVTPQSATDALNNAKMVAGMTELPGQSRIEASLAGNTAGVADAVKQMGGGASGMGAIVDAYANENRQLSALEVEAAKLWNANQGALRGQLNNIAGYENQANQREINEYNATMGEASDLKGAAIANLYGAAKGGVNSYNNNELLNMAKEGLGGGGNGLNFWNTDGSLNLESLAAALKNGTITQEQYDKLTAGSGSGDNINYKMFDSLLNNGSGNINPSQMNG